MLNNTLLTFLDKCKSLSELKQIQAQIIELGLTQYPPFASRILSFTVTSNFFDIEYSYKFFLQLSSPAIFHYNTIIRGYSNSRNPNKGICVFVNMLRSGVDRSSLPCFIVAPRSSIPDPRMSFSSRLLLVLKK